MSGEEEAEQDPQQAYSGKYFISLAQIPSVRGLGVASTTGRSGIRKRSLCNFLTLSHRNGDDKIEKSKRFPARCPVGDTGESLTRRTEWGEITGKNATEERERGGEEKE